MICHFGIKGVLQPRQEICQLPVVKGPCFASWKRYAFVKEKNRCELFYFGGCQGNRNNFRTADDCYKTCGGEEPNTSNQFFMMINETENQLCHFYSARVFGSYLPRLQQTLHRKRLPARVQRESVLSNKICLS